MITLLPDQFTFQAPLHFQDIRTRTAMKLPVAYENARQAYFRTLYGFQPAQGTLSAFVYYATIRGTVVAVEIYFIWSVHNPVGVFNMPFHVFKKDGKVIEKSADIEGLVGYQVKVTVAARYKFNGISVLTVTCIEVESAVKPIRVVRAQSETTHK